MKSETHIYGVIPARYASTRFPGKPLVDIHGKTMIRRVYEQAQKAPSLARVIVATDDERIFDEVQGFGGAVEMTGAQHQSGTERLAEVATRHPEATHFINVQGDEPFVAPEHIDQLAAVIRRPEVQVGTLARRFYDAQLLRDPSIIKVVMGLHGQALYFSRLPVPYFRGALEGPDGMKAGTFLKHIHLYGFRREVLLQYPSLAPTELEQMESLEQLRWMAHGYPIHVGLSEIESFTIETPEDLQRIPERFLEA